MSKLDNGILTKYRAVDIATLEQKDKLGQYHFGDILPELIGFKKFLDEMIALESLAEDITPVIPGQIHSFINHWVQFCTRIQGYNLAQDAQSNFAQRNAIINELRTWWNNAITGSQNNNFFHVYHILRTFSKSDPEKERKEYLKLLGELQSTKGGFDNLVNELKQKASEHTVSSYAQIFAEQSSQHSKFTFSKLFPFIHIGKAQLWLIAAVVSAFILTVVLYNINSQLPTETILTNDKTGEKIIHYETGNIIARILIISLIIFTVSFAFKQYNVNMHLHTMNKHRQNALNSFQLFLESIKDDANTRNALMLHLSKAIYEQGRTGYLNDKSNTSSSGPSVIEMTKFFENK